MPLQPTDKPIAYLNVATPSTYPLSERDIKRMFKQTSFPSTFSPPDGFVPVYRSLPPTYNPITQAVREIAPKSANGHYEQDYEVIELDAEAVAANQARADAAVKLAAQNKADIAARDFAKADSIVKYLRDHTPSEVEAYVQNNVTDLASARSLMKKFAVVLCVLAKQELR